MLVPQVEGEAFIQTFNSTGPFEGVPDDVDIEDIPAKNELYSLQLHAEDSVDQGIGTVAPSQVTPHSTPFHITPRARRSQGAKSDTDSVYLPFPAAD